MMSAWETVSASVRLPLSLTAVARCDSGRLRLAVMVKSLPEGRWITARSKVGGSVLAVGVAEEVGLLHGVVHGGVEYLLLVVCAAAHFDAAQLAVPGLVGLGHVAVEVVVRALGLHVLAGVLARHVGQRCAHDEAPLAAHAVERLQVVALNLGEGL